MKKIFYYTDILPLLSKGEAAVDKIKRSLELFKRSAGQVTLIWHPWSRTEEYLKLNDSPVIDSFIEMTERFINEDWGILDRNDSVSEAMNVLLDCDAYYGDAGELMLGALNAGKPVMIQNYDM
ncbi:MAG: hypothetical protein K6F34_09680 [Lachnospiraceae bacterium]|nr:hypothetical protein [Lachnospiraceae bacterium]